MTASVKKLSGEAVSNPHAKAGFQHGNRLYGANELILCERVLIAAARLCRGLADYWRGEHPLIQQLASLAASCLKTSGWIIPSMRGMTLAYSYLSVRERSHALSETSLLIADC
jgi:hypothetical protein